MTLRKRTTEKNTAFYKESDPVGKKPVIQRKSERNSVFDEDGI